MFKTTKIAFIIAVVLLFTGFGFKTLHWPGANVLLVCGAISGITLFVTLLIGIPSVLSGKMEKISLIAASLTMIVGLSAFLFKSLHWPGAGELIRIADFGILFSTITILIDGLIEKKPEKLRLKIIAAFFGLFLLLIIFLSS